MLFHIQSRPALLLRLREVELNRGGGDLRGSKPHKGSTSSWNSAPHSLKAFDSVLWSLTFGMDSLINTDQNSRCECITYGPSLTSIIYTSASSACFHFDLSLYGSSLHLPSRSLPLRGVVILYVRTMCFICIWKGDFYLPPLSVMKYLIYFAHCGWLTLLVALVLKRALILTQHLQ